MVVAGHHRAAEAGAAVLRAGGNAIDAAVATAATLAIAIPFMNGLGGDCIALYARSPTDVTAINGSGAVAMAASVEELRRRGCDAMPMRGPFSVSVPGFVAAMGESLERFLVGLREHRLAYVDLFTAQTYRRRLHSPLRAVNSRKRRRMVDMWARYYERVYRLDPADALGLSSFQYDGLRGLVAQVDAGVLPAQEAIRLFLEVLTGAAERLAAKPRRPGARSGRARAPR